MKVFVVMGNDFPESVFETEAAAEKYVEQKKAADPEHRKQYGGPRIYWRTYEFEVRQ